ncbi:uncharacterized protein YwgA [Pullulanibacillus pueri]|uniref:YwgA family protein n=1 Tax=Pullulanibacillus pueri TaxID=1437324 RepID=A0A8J2ZZ42_9BACL|nr:YwgA family protein [Pullulanibacillus pueri]MBM7681678.1 uncharacterized protein YwgA [Pullulanibacillus pueri]GGH86996.1 hypothetical protein GCM10007096_35990 [Pullulanibacillus pueri]
MLEDHAKVMTLLQVAGEVVGRKKLQKILYILQKLDYPFQEKYQFHFYGPYSEELTLKIEELCNLQFVNEVREKKGGYHQYRYQLTHEGEDFLKNYQIEMPNIDAFIEDLNGESSRFLELVSTIFYFDHLSEEEVIEKVKIVKQKQNYQEEEIRSGLDYVQRLKGQRMNEVL